MHALDRLERVSRRTLAVTPTPLLSAPNLARALGGPAPEILLKLDGATGFALGGNKVRKLEFELSPERLRGVDTVITTGGPQSNHCRVTAAAAARLGLSCILVLNGPEPEVPTGNALLHRLYGAEIRTVEDRERRAEAMERAAREVAERGGRALVVPLGASTPLGALGYARAFREIHAQIREERGGWSGRRTWIFVSTSSGGTLAGLLLGRALTDAPGVELVGVSADVPADQALGTVRALARESGRLLGWEGSLPAGVLHASDAYVGDGYGIPTPASREAMRMLARSEGVLTDPTYTAKAAAGTLDWIRSGRVDPGDRVVFWHTGGEPGLFA